MSELPEAGAIENIQEHINYGIHRIRHYRAIR